MFLLMLMFLVIICFNVKNAVNVNVCNKGIVSGNGNVVFANVNVCFNVNAPVNVNFPSMLHNTG